MGTSKIVWREVTRNCHVGRLDDVPVATVERSQKNRPDGTKHDWKVIVLGDRYTWDKTFCQHDPHDLDSTKSTAEARVKWAIECLYRSLKGQRSRNTARESRPEAVMVEKAKKPWVRPEGCECDAFAPARHRCTANWMRCNARIDFALRRARKYGRRSLGRAQ